MINQLKQNTILQNGDLTINKVIGQGGFGINYFATDRLLGEVVIKELFIETSKLYCIRDNNGKTVTSNNINKVEFEQFKKRFLDEGKTLVKLKHVEGVVEVYRFFEENETAYLVMEYIPGDTIQEIVNNQGIYPESKVIDILSKIAKSLTLIHKHNVLHRDIKPSNIIIKPDGKPVLIDFGIARDFEEGKTALHTAMFTPGYAPPEQKIAKAKRGKYTDVFGLGATAYFMLTAKRPQTADEITMDGYRDILYFNNKVSKNTSNTISKAIKQSPNDRWQDVKSFIDQLLINDSISEINTQRLNHNTNSELNKTTKSRSKLKNWVFPVIIGMLSLILTSFWLYSKKSNSKLEVYESNGKYGYKNNLGDIVISARYDFASPFLNSKAKVNVSDSVFIIDETGKLLDLIKPDPNEERTWQEAFNENTILSYNEYLNQYKNGKYKRKAIENIKTIKNRIDAKNKKKREEDRVRKLISDTKAIESAIYNHLIDFKGTTNFIGNLRILTTSLDSDRKTITVKGTFLHEGTYTNVVKPFVSKIRIEDNYLRVETLCYYKWWTWWKRWELICTNGVNDVNPKPKYPKVKI